MLRTNFNKDWTVGINVDKLANVFLGESVETKRVDLPYDAMFYTERTPDSPTGTPGGFFQAENYEYSKTYFADEADQGKVISLNFEGVYMNAFVYVNGDFAGKCPYGYDDFVVRIDDFLRYGQNNTISVIAKNKAQNNSRWYTGSGIYRDVHLMKSEPVFIEPDGVRLTTEQATAELSVIRVDIAVQNVEMHLRTATAETIIKDEHGEAVAQSKVRISVPANGKANARLRLSIDNAHLWDVNSPYLYTVETTLHVGDKVYDMDRTTFGIRTLQLDAKHGLQLNGKSVKLKGGCIHHDNGVIGAATFPDADERRVIKIKAAGYNAIRSAHNPMSKSLLNACDKHGMLVMDELFDNWLTSIPQFEHSVTASEWWEFDVENFVRKNYNHPCVVLYSIGNEIPEISSPHGLQFARNVVDRLRSLDNTRYITLGINPITAVAENLMEIAAKSGIVDTKVFETGEVNEIMMALGLFLAK